MSKDALTRGGRAVFALLAVAAIVSAGTANAIRTTLGGRRVDLDVATAVREVIEENRASTHEPTLVRMRVRAGAELTDWLRFDSMTVGTVGGPTLLHTRAGIYTWTGTFQDVSPAVDFEEIYFDINVADFDLRIGKQRLAWGKLDRFQPTDVLAPFSYIDPLLLDEAERKIGVPALQGSYYLPGSLGWLEENRFTVVWVPRYLPYRFPVAGCTLRGTASQCGIERWFPPAAVPSPPYFTVPAGSFVPPNPRLEVPLTYGLQDDNLPAFNLPNSGIGLRHTARVGTSDVALYYYHGYDNNPAFLLTADAAGNPDPASPIGVKDLRGITTLSPAFADVDMGGFDVAYAYDRFAVRGEAAFINGRNFARDVNSLLRGPTLPDSFKRDLQRALVQLAMGAGRVPVSLPPSAVKRNAVEWGLGADYTYEGYMLLVQVNQTDVIDNDEPLLIQNIDTRLLANLRKSFFSDTLQAQLLGLQGIESGYSMLRTRIRYKFTDHILAEAGYLFVSGRSQSVIGQYKRNGQGWIQLEYVL
ncbi:hypothetical protein L6Q96_08145 [Candidatus Binatia bacterium]|nr:hypothetical protein [Candidatus Binatia bacterium]